MRLIDADAYADEMRKRQNECKKLIEEARKNKSSDVEYWNGIYATFVEAKLTLDSIPTVDAVPVVRCKDCKWWDKKAESPYGYCHACKHGHYSEHWEIGIYRVYKGDWFCADGERKEDDDDDYRES